MDLQLLAIAVLIIVSILLVPVSARIGAPLLLLFLGLGMLLGEDGPGRIYFDDFSLAYEVGAAALAIILLSGGLDTKRDQIRTAALPALVLATVGVVLTGAFLGAAASLFFGVPLAHGLLLGAVVGSTDAAATFLLLRQRNIRLRGRIRETLLVESGINDPMAIFLTLTFVEIVGTGTSLGWSTLPELLPELGLQLGLGAVAGLAGGWMLGWLVNRVHLPSGLYPILVLAGAFAIFAGTRLGGGSGFLAVYLAGIVLADRLRVAERIAHFHDGLAWLCQIVMFTMLGLLVTPSDLGTTFMQAMAAAAVLMFIARPLAVILCLAPFRFPLRDQIYIGWVGLRGGVPIFLAIIPVISPGPVNVGFFNVVFVIVIASLVLQGWTMPIVARWLGVSAAPAAGS